MKKFLSGFLIFTMVFGMLSFGPSKASAVATTIFSDSFDQSGNDITNSWYTSGSEESLGSDARDDFSDSSWGSVEVSGKALLIEGSNGTNPDEGIQRDIATMGYSTLTVQYSRATNSFGAGDELVVKYSLDDGAFVTLETVTGNNAHSNSALFSIDNSDRKTKLTLKFYVNGSSTDDEAGIDNLVVTGDNAPLFYDGFENGWQSQWTTHTNSQDIEDESNTNIWTDENTSSLGNALEMDDGSDSKNEVILSFPTTGYQAIKVRYAREVENLSTGEGLRVGYSIDGTNYTDLEARFDNDSYESKSFTIPNTADNNANFKIRFDLLASSGNDNAYIDDVVVWGDVAVVKTNPTLSVSNSPVTYNGSTQSATVAGSVAGVVSDIKYDGSSTAPTNAGTYAVTADFAPTDTINYNNLSDASAGNFVINKADATITVTPYSVTYDALPHTAAGTAKGVMDEDLSGLDLSGTTHTAVGTYSEDPWTFTDVTGNYNNLAGTVNDLISEVVLPPATTKVTIVKYINGVPATAENTGGATFPMTASWSAENIGTGSGSYTLSSTGFNNPNPYQATTSDMTTGADYSTYENTPTTCAPESQYALVGYSTGNTLEGAAGAEVTETVPSFTNLASDKFIIVWNKTCVPLPVHVSPADNIVRTTAEQTLIDWTDVINWALPISYIYQASNGTDTNPDGSFLSPVYTSVPLAMSEIPTPGTPEGVYFWHVKAMDAGMNSSGWTAPWKITIDNTPEPMCSEDATTTVVSDETTMVGEAPASPVTPHPAWTSLTDATWIYNAPLNESGSSATGDMVFTKTFNVVGTPLDSTLEVAADNMYSVSVNGNPLTTGSSATDIDNFSSVDTWNIPASMLVTGENAIAFTVTNPAVNPNNPEEVYSDPNPAGLLFKITVHQNECVIPEDPEPTYAKVHIFKYLKNVESTVQVSDESGLPSFPMTASWDTTNIGAGTGDYVLGNNHGGTVLKYAADTTAMQAPVASYSTYERTGVEAEGQAYVLAPEAQCVANTYRLVGYKTGGSLESAQLMATSTTVPTFTNFSTDQYVIVVNEDCDDVLAQENDDEDNNEGPTTGTLIVRKLVINDQGGVKGASDFSFSVNGGEPISFIDSPDEDSMTGENQITLNPGTYTVTEGTVEGYLKFSEIGCSEVTILAGETKTCSFVNYDYIIPTGGSSGGNSGLGGGQVLGASTENTGGSTGTTEPKGEVLGDNACNTPYLNDYIFFGKKNNPEQVKLLQAFLNEHMGTTLKVDGVYGKTTRDAVKAFQVKYLDEVLTPWKSFGLKDNKGTGNVYKTTKRKINMIKCEALNLPIPQLP